MNHWTQDICDDIVAQLADIPGGEICCIVDCMWDSDEEYAALKACFDRMHDGFFEFAEYHGILNDPGVFQCFPFTDLELAREWCNDTPTGMPHVSVWYFGDLVATNEEGFDQ